MGIDELTSSSHPDPVPLLDNPNPELVDRIQIGSTD
jgi:hypothetical protein